jgi:hypothetical protein
MSNIKKKEQAVTEQSIETQSERSRSITKPSGVISGILEEISATKVTNGELHEAAYIRLSGQRLKTIVYDNAISTVLHRAIKSNKPIDLSFHNGFIFACKFNDEVTHIQISTFSIIMMNALRIIAGIMWGAGVGGTIGVVTSSAILGILVFVIILVWGSAPVRGTLSARNAFGEES